MCLGAAACPLADARRVAPAPQIRHISAGKAELQVKPSTQGSNGGQQRRGRAAALAPAEAPGRVEPAPALLSAQLRRPAAHHAPLTRTRMPAGIYLTIERTNASNPIRNIRVSSRRHHLPLPAASTQPGKQPSAPLRLSPHTSGYQPATSFPLYPVQGADAGLHRRGRQHHRVPPGAAQLRQGLRGDQVRGPPAGAAGPHEQGRLRPCSQQLAARGWAQAMPGC
jgi:hypothetical protein